MESDRWFKRVAFALLTLTAACSNATGPGFTVSFGAADLNSQSEFATVTVSGSEILVTGNVVLGDPCYSGDGRLEESGMTLTLHVSSGHHSGGACVAAVAHRPYTARIPASGVHDVIVVHETNGLTPPPREIARVRVTVR